MTERPLLCAGSVVRNILSGAQTQDRRPIRGQDYLPHPMRRVVCPHRGVGADWGEGTGYVRAPWQPGDLLYCRERTRVEMVWDGHDYMPPSPSYLDVVYEADGYGARVPWPERIKRPTIGHCLANGCYREAARLWLRVEDVWAERVQDITEDGAMAEGCRIEEHGGMMLGAPAVFARLWDSLYAKRGLGLDANPWVWACRFTVASTTGRPS